MVLQNRASSARYLRMTSGLLVVVVAEAEEDDVALFAQPVYARILPRMWQRRFTVDACASRRPFPRACAVRVARTPGRPP